MSKFDNIIELIQEDIYAAHELYAEVRDVEFTKMVNEYLSGKERVYIPKVPAPRIKKIWLDYGKTGVVRDSKGLHMIKDIIRKALCRLELSTALMGHADYFPWDMFEEEEYDPSDFGIDKTDNWEVAYDELYSDEKWNNFFTDEHDNWYLSDYGLKPLQKFFFKAEGAKTDEDMLYNLDRMLNVIHARSDLSAWFIQGGQSTLTDIFNQGGYTSEV